MDVELLYFDDCPHWRTADIRLREVAAEYGVTVRHHRITGIGETEAFAGSPTVLIDGSDAFPGTAPARQLSCRLYDTPDGRAGSPTVEQLRAALSWSGHANKPGMVEPHETEPGENG